MRAEGGRVEGLPSMKGRMIVGAFGTQVVHLVLVGVPRLKKAVHFLLMVPVPVTSSPQRQRQHFQPPETVPAPPADGSGTCRKFTYELTS